LRIAVASEGLEVSPHFGRCSNYNYYTAENGVIMEYRNLPREGQLCDVGASLMKDLGIDVVITGGIGSTAYELLDSYGISVISGVTGTAREAVDQYLSGNLLDLKVACES